MQISHSSHIPHGCLLVKTCSHRCTINFNELASCRTENVQSLLSCFILRRPMNIITCCRYSFSKSWLRHIVLVDTRYCEIKKTKGWFIRILRVFVIFINNPQSVPLLTVKGWTSWWIIRLKWRMWRYHGKIWRSQKESNGKIQQFSWRNSPKKIQDSPQTKIEF